MAKFRRELGEVQPVEPVDRVSGVSELGRLGRFLIETGCRGTRPRLRRFGMLRML